MRPRAPVRRVCASSAPSLASQRAFAYSASRPNSAASSAAVATWEDGECTVHPVTICRVAPVTSAPDGCGDVTAFETELEIHARGYRWCQCFTLVCPNGEFGHIQEPLLLPLSQAEFEAALYALRRGDDMILGMWLKYRLEVVRDELASWAALAGRYESLSPVTPIDADGRPWRAL